MNALKQKIRVMCRKAFLFGCTPMVVSRSAPQAPLHYAECQAVSNVHYIAMAMLAFVHQSCLASFDYTVLEANRILSITNTHHPYKNLTRMCHLCPWGIYHFISFLPYTLY